MPVGAKRSVLRAGKMPRITIIAEGAQGTDGALGEQVQADFFVKPGTVLTGYVGLLAGWGGPGNLSVPNMLANSQNIARRAAPVRVTAQTTNNLVVTIPATCAVGDLFVVYVECSAQADIHKPPPKFRLIMNALVATGTERCYVYTHYVEAGEAGTTVTFTKDPKTGSNNLTAVSLAYYSQSTGGRLDVGDYSHVEINSAVTAYNHPGLTPTHNARGLLLSILYGDASTGTATPPSGMTEIHDGATTGGHVAMAEENYTGKIATGARNWVRSATADGGVTLLHIYECNVGGGATSVWWDSINKITAGGGGGMGCRSNGPGWGGIGEVAETDGTDYGGDGGDGGAGALGGLGGLGGAGYTVGAQGATGAQGGGGGGGGGGNAQSNAAVTVLGGAGGAGGSGANNGSAGGSGSNGTNTNGQIGTVGSGGSGGNGGTGAENGQPGDTPPVGAALTGDYGAAWNDPGNGGNGGRGGYGADGAPGANGANFTAAGASNIATASLSRSGDGRIRIYKNGVLVATWTAAGQTTQTYTVTV